VRKTPKYAVIQNVRVGANSRIYDLVNLFGCRIGNNTKIDSYVYMEEGVKVGSNCKIRPFVFIPTGVTIEDNVFIGPNVTFTNDKYPKSRGKWTLMPTRVRKFASIGAGSTIVPGITIGRNALVGAGSTVTKSIPANAIVVGSPARIVGHRAKPD